jgi:hypothetical protein
MQQTEWGPPAAGIAAAAVFGVLLAAGSVTVVTDVPGRALVTIAAVGLLLFATMSWRARPKLAITDGGLAVKGWFRTQLLEPNDVAKIRITEFRRIGRKVRLLVFTRWDLGTDPLEVLDALTAAGYAGR